MTIPYKEIIALLGLEPLPFEGGYFRSTYASEQVMDLGKGYLQPVGTGIYFLLTESSFSALHRLKEDELYHFYLGDPVELFEFSDEGTLMKTVLGQDLLSGQRVQHLVKKHHWHGSQIQGNGDWALLGTTMAPGFVWEDFDLGKRDQLISEYPAHKHLIMDLTREHD